MSQFNPEHHTGAAVPRTGFFLRKPIIGGIEILGRRLRREVALNTENEESVRLCLRGELGHALVCLDDRLLILKRGFHAGTTFGAMAATIFYPDVTGIQVRMQLFSGWIEISSPSFQGTDRRRSGRGRRTDHGVYRQPNCVPIQRRHLGAYQVALAELRRLIAAAKQEHDRDGVVSQLERLAVLHRQGLLDEREFAAAKSSLVGPGNGSGDLRLSA